MTPLRTLSRGALGIGITVARLPLDTVFRVMRGRATATSVELAADRADAAVRNIVGIALGDEQLVRDAEARRSATDERMRAMRLHAEADARAERANERVEEAQEGAQERRSRAAQSAGRRRRQAKERRDSVKSQAAKEAGRRKQAARQETGQAKRRVEQKAKPARVAHLEAKAAALEEKEAALRTADESQRLQEAASKAKRERKART